MKDTKRFSCECNTCKGACANKPGWFLPGEPEKVAEYLGLSLQELFNNHLSVDWYASDELDCFPISPAAKQNTPGDMWPYNPKGECVFFENGSCKIHPVAPFECREYSHNDSHEKVNQRHKKVAESWIGMNLFVEELLGFEPYQPEPDSLFDMFGLGW